MRHRKSGKTLGRKSAHRTAMFRNMARALLTYERIRTTEVKAKELRKIMDKLVTLALKDDLHARRQAYKILGNHGLVKKLFDEMAPKFSGGTGGYTRIIKLALPRKGDCAPMAIIEFAFVGDVKAEEPASTPAPTEAPSEEPKVEEAAVVEEPEAPAEEAAEEALAEEETPAEEPEAESDEEKK